MENKICCFFNTPSFYRESIYKMIDNEYDCDWYFGDYNEKVRSFDVKVLKRVFILHVINSGKKIYWTKGLISLLFNKGYNTYFCYGPTRDLNFWLFLILKVLFFRKKKLNLWVHGWYGKENFFESLLKKIMFSIADGIFCYGDYARNKLIEIGFSKDKIFSIHNSLDYDVQKNIRINVKQSSVYNNYFNNNNPTIIFIGRLTPIKRLDILIEAIFELKLRGDNYNLVLIGDGPQKNILIDKVIKLRLEKNVWFYGACYDEYKNAELIYNADLCVAPGNIGLTAIHCLMFGTPCITHNDFPYQMPEFEAIKPYETGLFFQRGNVKSLTDTIQKWFDKNKMKRNQIRLNCYQEIDKNWNPNYQIHVIKQNLKQ